MTTAFSSTNSPATARFWRVRVGGMDHEQMIDLHAFFPSEIVIHAGDSILFEFPTPPRFHTVTFLPSDRALPLLVDGETARAEMACPLIVNPAVAFPGGGMVCDGVQVINSGLDVVRVPEDPPFVITFRAPGRYDYRSLPHGTVMRGVVHVLATAAALPEDEAGAEARGALERATLLATGPAITTMHAAPRAMSCADGSTLWEIAAGAGDDQARILRFLPATLEIKAGDTVRWINHSRSEPHTVTFLGAGAEQPEDIRIEADSAGLPRLVQNPLTFFPQGDRRYRGEGLTNSGFLGEIDGQLLPGGFHYDLTFDAPGVYPYYSVLHGAGPAGPGMTGTIIVS
ncbi:MAG: plastocyanin/azurin family copper-binding protein [Thermomicrobiales bacterium]